MAEAVMNYYKADDLGGLYKMITKIIKSFISDRPLLHDIETIL